MKNLLLMSVLLVTAQSQATTTTFGNLVTDGANDYITDNTTGRQYTRFDVVSLNYSESLAAVQPGGAWEGWSIATSKESDEFISALLGTDTTPCTGAAPYGTECGTIQGWRDGTFGASYVQQVDAYAYLSTEVTPNFESNLLGIALIEESEPDSRVFDTDDWSNEEQFNNFTVGGLFGDQPINFLLFREAADEGNVPAVPLPAAAPLFSVGILGLGFFFRRARH